MSNAKPDTDAPTEIAATQEMALGNNDCAPPTTIVPVCGSSIVDGVPPTEHGSRMGSTYINGPFPFTMPSVGQSFLGFELIEELGRGTSGVVFLCKQAAMAERRVVLKVTKDKATEVQTLARLKHTNIVPIYSAHEGPGFLAICMPYYGGLTFSTVLSQLRSNAELPESGAFFVRLLKESSASEGAAIAARTLDRLSYPDAVLWFAARLAEGLMHAHDRGLVHCDIKPANLLLADDGQPMLLDFDVALDLQTVGLRLSKIGGTLQYMSIDQLELLLEARKTIDRRSDLYSLGIVLYELLTGQMPFEPPEDASRPEIERAIAARRVLPPLVGKHPALNATIEAIIHKCLAPKITERYPSAGAFVEDVQRYFNYQPLRYAKVRSVRERLWRWMKRNPKIMSPTMLVAMLAVALLCSGLIVIQQRQHAQLQALERQRQNAQDLYARALPPLQLAQANLVNALPKSGDRHMARQHAAEALAAYRVLEDEAWAQDSSVTALAAADRAHLETEIGTLLFLLACPERGQSPTETMRRAHQRATEALGDQARAALQRQAADYQKGMPTPPTTFAAPLDQLLYACEEYATGAHAAALEHVKEFSDAHPASYLGWLLRGHTHTDLRQDSAAIAAYSACIALRADVPETYYRRGFAYFSHREYTAALADFDLAIQFVPHHHAARMHRAQTYQQLNQPQKGIPDLDYLLAQPNPPVKFYFMRARLRALLGDKELAYTDEIEGMKHTPTDEASWIERGLSRMKLNPEGALEDFRKAEEINPHSFPALHNQACVLNDQLHRPQEAIKVLDRVLAFYPNYAVSLADRAVLLAREGSRDAALRDVKRVAQLDQRATTLYQMALVYALLSAKEPKEANYPKMAMRLLAQAFRAGYDLDRLDHEPVFDVLREQRGYDAFRFAIRTLAQNLSE